LSIQIDLKNFSNTQVKFNYSALHELLISLHVLEDYQAYPLHLNWSLTTLRAMPDDLKQEREYFHLLLSTLIFCLIDLDHESFPSFKAELNAFATQPLEEFTNPILSRLLLAQPPGGKTILEDKVTVEQLRRDDYLQSKARQWIDTHYPDSHAFFDDLLNRPATVKTRFVKLLEAYWTHVFADFWEHNERHFIQDIADKGRILLKYDTMNVLDKLSPKMNIIRGFPIITYVVSGVKDRFVLDQDDTLTLNPSFFTYPMLVFSVRGEKEKAMRLSITYPLATVYDISTSPVLADELVDIVSAISDPTRLKILRLVAQQDRSTTELAQILNLSDAAISKHLRVLKNGGWVASERNSYYVMYRAIKAPLSSLNRGIEDIFHR